MGEAGHPADRLEQRCGELGSRLCVGLDPHLTLLPPSLPGSDDVSRCRHFLGTLLDALAPEVPVVKPQIAFFEALGVEGWRLYFDVIRLARSRGCIVIGDIKRSDIGSTAAAYAQAHLGCDSHSAVDFVTLNPYMGSESLRPFLEVGRARGKGIFVLARTSNPSSCELQNLSCEGRPLYSHVADGLASLGAASIGDSGWSDVGAVVGATHSAEAQELRQRLPQSPFLVPGYGAQGARAKDVVACFRADGTGAVVNSSRAVLFAWRAPENDPERWVEAAVEAARRARDEIRRALEERSPSSPARP